MRPPPPQDLGIATPDAIKVETTSEGTTSAEVKCKRVWVSQVIGAGGETINKIKAESGADIKVGDDDPVTITVSGSAPAVAKATAAIQSVLKEAENPDYEGEAGKALRAKADEFARKMDAAAAEKDELFNNGDKNGGHRKLEEVKEWQRKMHAANAEAAEAIFQHRNAGKGERYMDFHGLRKQETLDILEKRLGSLQGGALELVPGAGHHSSGEAVLKPAIISFLKSKGISFEEKNAGTIVANL
eukprot:CAMPEP_0177771890 /NCGR_PEP_ID=MMETSP0491_2-20121128/11884_1 /TAXON_ID=63592 /ORGANISM="Tetraselmis chuii, Strain PLY429" /LENGTH=243 /DNA_ID=CAMNT_0019289571 /DNA_START=212 /DNA_END=942 /DNA_ORIENTATION=-